jgi:hypothetical protein
MRSEVEPPEIVIPDDDACAPGDDADVPPLQKAWKDTIAAKKIPWSLWITLTFSSSPPLPTATKHVEKFLRKVGYVAYGNDVGRLKQVPWLACIEPHDSGSLHGHALVADVDDVRIRRIASLWYPRGIIHIEKYDPTKGDPERYIVEGADREAEVMASREAINYSH